MMSTKQLYAKSRSVTWNSKGTVTDDKTVNSFMGTQIISRSFPTRKKPKGFLPPTNASATEQDGHGNLYTNWFSRMHSTVTGDTNVSTGAVPWGFAAGNASFDADLASRAEIKALLNLKNQNINLAVAFGERAQTAALITETATTLASAISALKTLNVRKFKKVLRLGGLTPRDRKILKSASPAEKKVRKFWLSYSYGWTPLLSDVYGAANQLAQHDASQPDRYRSTVKAAISKHTTTYQDILVDTPLAKTRRQVSGRTDQGAFVSLTYYLENPLAAEAAQLGLTNPASVAWELVPFSFVADWFYPIGNYINALDANVGWHFMGGSCSRRLRQTTTVIGILTNPKPTGYDYRYGGGFGRHNYRSFSRSTYASSPVPDLVRPTNPFNGRRMMNALALLSQVCR